MFTVRASSSQRSETVQNRSTRADTTTSPSPTVMAVVVTLPKSGPSGSSSTAGPPARCAGVDTAGATVVGSVTVRAGTAGASGATPGTDRAGGASMDRMVPRLYARVVSPARSWTSGATRR